MNQTIETIAARRSVRAYDPKPVSQEDLDTIITVATLAPTGMNAQPWRFVVVEKGPFYDKLSVLATPRYQAWIEHAPEPLKQMRAAIDAQVSDPVYYDAPAVVFVIGAGATASFDCSMACQNMMLAARSLGIGSCWVYFGQLVLDEHDIREAFELTEGEAVFGPILLGYPKDGVFPDMPPKNEPKVIRL